MRERFRPALRAAILVAAAAGTLFWLGVAIRALSLPLERRDDLALAGVVLSTVHFLSLVLPALVLGLLDRWLPLAAVLALAALALAGHALLPWPG